MEVLISVNTISPSFMWLLFKVKYIKYDSRNNIKLCLNHRRIRKYGPVLFNHTFEPNYGTCYQMTRRNVKAWIFLKQVLVTGKNH